MQLVDIALVMVLPTPSRFCRCRRLRFHYIHPNRRIRLSHSYRAGYGTGGDVLLSLSGSVSHYREGNMALKTGAVVGLAGAGRGMVSSAGPRLFPRISWAS